MNREIAIVGLSCRYPGAGGPRELWENSLASRRQFRRIPDCRFPLADYFDPNARDKTYAQRVAVMDWKDFDFESHGISRATFEAVDAVQWLALEVAIEAMSDAGYAKAGAPRARSGVIFGNTLNGEQSRTNGIRLRWPFIARALREAAKRSGMSPRAIEDVVGEVETVLKSVFAELSEDSLQGSMASAIAGRIASHFGFDGASMIVDGACASSLLAIATAAGKLERGELDLAIAGGVDISLDPLEMIGFAGAHALSRGEMSVYDRRASGFIPGEGCGVIVMKRLADAARDGDPIHAVIRGWGVSSDGRGAIAAPSSIGQSKAILRAYEHAGYAPRDLDFIEGHGTGTPVGDRAELEAVYSAIRADRDAGPSKCGITSLKSLIGHTKAASGIGGLIKATMAVNQRVLPPTANCASPHVLFEVTAPRLYPLVEGEMRDPSSRLRAGVSGMGFGGINCHITLESYGAPSSRFAPSLATEHLLATAQETEVFVFAAASKAALIERLDFVASLAIDASIAEMTDLAASLALSVGSQPCRAALVAHTPESLVQAIEKLKASLLELPGEAIDFVSVDRRSWARFVLSPAKIGMIFPGQGSQQLNVGRVLVKRHAWAAALVADADRWMEEMGSPVLSPLLFRSLASARKEELDQYRAALTETSIAQPAICLTSLLWARFLALLGVEPVAVAGHSLGELSAFAIAGAFDEEHLIKLAAKRGQAMSGLSGGTPGTMASLMCSRARAEEILARVSGYAVVANINGPAQTVISGEVEAVLEVMRLCEAESISARRLSVSNAFHSRLVSRASEVLSAESPVRGPLPLLETAIIAGATGEPVPMGREMSAHFAEQVLDRVDFVSMIGTIGRACELLIEVGPSRVLSGMAAEVLGASGPMCLPIESAAGGDRDLNAVIAALFVHGHDLALEHLFEGRLVRPFVAARERAFFTNPCERPFAAASEPKTPAAILATTWAKSLGLPSEMIEDYLEKRGEVITEVIRADLALPPVAPLALVPAAALAAEEEEEEEDDDDEESTARDPRESHPSAIARQGKRIEKEIIKTVADRLEIDPSAIDVEQRLTAELGLSIEDALETIEDVAEISKVEGLIDARALVHATITQLANAMRLARRSKRPVLSIKRGTADLQGPSEVRCLASFAWTPAPLPELRTDSEDWETARAVILCDDPQRAAPLAADLEARGALVFVLPYSAAPGLARGRFSHVFALDACSIARLRFAAEASLDGTPLGRKKNNALILAGTNTTAFARSLQLERPHLRVRAADLAPSLNAAELARCALRELSAPGRFSAARYDAAMRRFERSIAPFVSAPGAVTWSKDQLLLVTGGAEGIAAECAIAFAFATGARVAVFSRPDETSEPDPARRVIIERNLARYPRVEHRFVDLTDEAAVRAACASLGEVSLVIHGEGAGREEPMLAERGEVDALTAAMAPQVMGAANLMRALSAHRLRAFVALTSSAGVTGRAEHAWSAYASENVHAALADFEAATWVRTLAIAHDVWSPIGMGGIGMGGESGAITEFNRHGSGAIPPREGARRFVELMTSDVPSSEVVVTAKSEEARDLRSA